MVLSPNIYGDFQDQPRFERKRKKKQCKERAVKRISKSVMLQNLKGPVFLHHSIIQKTQDAFSEGIPLRKEMQ